MQKENENRSTDFFIVSKEKNKKKINIRANRNKNISKIIDNYVKSN